MLWTWCPGVAILASWDPLKDPKNRPPIRTHYYSEETRGLLGGSNFWILWGVWVVGQGFGVIDATIVFRASACACESISLAFPGLWATVMVDDGAYKVWGSGALRKFQNSCASCMAHFCGALPSEGKHDSVRSSNKNHLGGPPW